MAALLMRCTRCRVEKPIKRFPKDRRAVSGHRNPCLECYAARQREYRGRRKAIALLEDLKQKLLAGVATDA